MLNDLIEYCSARPCCRRSGHIGMQHCARETRSFMTLWSYSVEQHESIHVLIIFFLLMYQANIVPD
jgi:hypothetical protein